MDPSSLLRRGGRGPVRVPCLPVPGAASLPPPVSLDWSTCPAPPRYLLLRFLQAFEQCHLEVIHQDSNHQAGNGGTVGCSRGGGCRRGLHPSLGSSWHDQSERAGERLPRGWWGRGAKLGSRAGAGSLLEKDEVLDDNVNHENGYDVPGTWERRGRSSWEFLAGPYLTAASKHQKPHFTDGVTEPPRSVHPASLGSAPPWARLSR